MRTLTQVFFMEGAMSLELAPQQPGPFSSTTTYPPEEFCFPFTSTSIPHNPQSGQQNISSPPSSCHLVCPTLRPLLSDIKEPSFVQARRDTEQRAQSINSNGWSVRQAAYRFTFLKEDAFDEKLQVDESDTKHTVRCPAKHKSPLYPPHNISGSRLRFPALWSTTMSFSVRGNVPSQVLTLGSVSRGGSLYLPMTSTSSFAV